MRAMLHEIGARGKGRKDCLNRDSNRFKQLLANLWPLMCKKGYRKRKPSLKLRCAIVALRNSQPFLSIAIALVHMTTRLKIFFSMSIFWSRFLQDYNTVNTVETIPGIHKDSPAKLIHLMEKRISSSECTNGALPFHCTFYETKKPRRRQEG